MNLTTIRAAILLTLSMSVASPAANIGPGGFSNTAVVINFDNLTGGNIFPSLSGDTINSQYQAQGIVFNNFSRPARARLNATNPSFSGTSTPNHAWFNEGSGDPGTAGNYLELDFSSSLTAVHRVGFKFGVSVDSRLELRLLNSLGVVIASGSTNNNAVGTYSQGFIGLAANEPVATARIISTRPSNNTGLNFSIDDLKLDFIPGGQQSSVVSSIQPTVSFGNNAAGGATLDFGTSITEPSNVSVMYQAIASSTYNAPAAMNFPLPIAGALQVWDVGFTGTIADGKTVQVTFQYDDTGMSLAQEQSLVLRHFTGGIWKEEASIVDTSANTITTEVSSFSPFVLAAIPEPSSIALFILGSCVISYLLKRNMLA